MIFVTGGTGFLGRHLVPLLCRTGHPLRILTRDPTRHTWLKRYPNVEVVQGNLENVASYQAALEGCRYVIHAAGKFRMWGNEKSFIQSNVTGTEALLKAVVQHPIEKFIHISTVAVIGQPDPESILDETYPPRPMDAYQRTKLMGEQMALSFYQSAGLPVVVLRPGAFYGPLGHYAFNRLFFRDPMRGLIMQGDGGRYIIFPVYISDVAQGILSALENGREGEVYNICGDWISHRDAFDFICAEANIRYPRINMPRWLGLPAAQFLEMFSYLTRQEPFWPVNLLRSYVYNNWRVSSDKARRDLGFAPMNFYEGARRTIAWYQAGKPEELPELNCV